MDYIQRIIELFTTRDFSDSAKNAFHQWLVEDTHRVEKDKALGRLWNNVSAEEHAETRHSLQRVKEKAGISRKPAITSLRIWQTVAAVLVLAIIPSVYFYIRKTAQSPSDLIEQYVPTAETAYVTLPDGSRVQLNSHSVLLYPKDFGGKNRSVYLMGEANFKVKPDARKPFIVKSADFQITVLGTEFNVSAYPEDSVIWATLLSGSIKAEYNNLENSNVLHPNQQLAYNKYTKREQINEPNIPDVTAWQRGELVFKSTTLKEILTILARKYPYDFSYNLASLKDDQYTFKFKDDASLPEVMDIISQVAGGIRYKIENNTCYIMPR